MTEQTDKYNTRRGAWHAPTSAPIIIATCAVVLFALFGLPLGLYYVLGRLQPNTVRLVATASLCITPLFSAAAMGIVLVWYRSRLAGLHTGLETAASAWHEVAGGLSKVAQARAAAAPHPAPTVIYPYGPPGLGAPTSSGMIIEQRHVPDGEY